MKSDSHSKPKPQRRFQLRLRKVLISMIAGAMLLSWAVDHYRLTRLVRVHREHIEHLDRLSQEHNRQVEHFLHRINELENEVRRRGDPFGE